MIFNNAEKKTYHSSCHCVLIQSWGTTCISQLGDVDWQQLSSPGATGKQTLRGIHTGVPVLPRWLGLPSDCWPKAAKHSSRSQEKVRIESWRSKASESTGENCSHAMPGAELQGEKRLQSAWKVRKSSPSNSNMLCLCNKNSKLLTQSETGQSQSPTCCNAAVNLTKPKNTPIKVFLLINRVWGGPSQVSCLTEAPPKPGWGEHPVSWQPWSSTKLTHSQVTQLGVT